MSAKNKTDKKSGEDTPPRESTKKPKNVAPDAVKDPNEKTGGKPGHGGSEGGDADPGAG